ncbi:MAG: pyridoxamine 5'-phosphate oxidase family protein [Dehalococcoidia bacterium]
MATWGEFEAAEPEMAGLGQGLLEIGYLATVRKDGAPRVHPVCPIFAAGRMFVAVAPSSPKRWDLRGDARYALHGLPGKQDEEIYVTGRARLVEEADTLAAVAGAAGHTVHADDWVFELGIERAMTAHWEKVGQPGTYPVRRWWPGLGRELPRHRNEPRE